MKSLKYIVLAAVVLTTGVAFISCGNDNPYVSVTIEKTLVGETDNVTPTARTYIPTGSDVISGYMDEVSYKCEAYGARLDSMLAYAVYQFPDLKTSGAGLYVKMSDGTSQEHTYWFKDITPCSIKPQ